MRSTAVRRISMRRLVQHSADAAAARRGSEAAQRIFVEAAQRDGGVGLQANRAAQAVNQHPSSFVSTQLKRALLARRVAVPLRRLEYRSLSTEATGKTEEEQPKEAAADVEPASEASLAPEEPKHFYLKMPEVTKEDKFGSVAKWFKKVGDAVKPGDHVCEIELEQFSINMSVDDTGFVAQLLVEAGKKQIPVGAQIAVIVEKAEDIPKFAAAAPEPAKAEDSEKPAAAAAATEAAVASAEAVAATATAAAAETFSFSSKHVLKVLHRLQKEEHLNEMESLVLQSLARKKDEELFRAFDSSFDADAYDEKCEFDLEFFTSQAKAIAAERAQQAAVAADD